MQKNHISKRQTWAEHIESANTYAGSASEYCQLKSLSRASFHYWKSKLARESAKNAVSSFAPLHVTRMAEPFVPSLPDPRWLATLIRNLQVGGA